MRVADLNHQELLEFDPEGGVIRFAGQRALLIDAVAMGLHRKYLVENFGLSAARAVLTQFGFAHGWRMAEAMKRNIKWASDKEWHRAGPHIYALEGLFHAQAGSEDALHEKGAMLLASYEAEQHLLHFGRSDATVCWTICGLLSGYLSQTAGKEIYVLEDRCLGQGHAACHIRGRTRSEWGQERAKDIAFFENAHLKDKLDISLSQVMDNLKTAEKKLRTHRQVLVEVVRDIEAPLGLIAKSEKMQEAVDLAQRVAKVDATVLITGESGVGKERIAQLIHKESFRATGPFIAINCAAITETLLESELFGHARGAFTGATSDRPGLFEAASHGTLLLDEIGEISTVMQVKLLRVLQEREIRRVGENSNRPVNTRIVTATNQNLAHKVAEGLFRQDLYYRLKVVEIHVPELSARREDILPLARLFLAKAATRMSRKVFSLSPSTADQLLRYKWPGNARELENAIERAVALARGNRVEVEDLPEEIRIAFQRPVVNKEAVQPLCKIEKDYILSVLALNNNNQTKTAKQLGIGSATLYRKLKKYREA